MNVKCFEIRKRVLGLEHPDTIVSMGRQLDILVHFERFEEAATLGEELLMIKTKVLGLEHVSTSQTMDDLFTTYTRLGQNDKALDLAEKAFDIKSKLFEKENLKTLLAMDPVGLYMTLGRQDDTINLLNMQIDALKRLLGPDHPRILNAFETLAQQFAIFLYLLSCMSLCFLMKRHVVSFIH